jgi:hypothetical protein
VLPRDFVLTEILIPDEISVEEIDLTSLPEGWNLPEPIAETRVIGTAWVESMRTPVLSVPSSIVARERRAGDFRVERRLNRAGESEIGNHRAQNGRVPALSQQYVRRLQVAVDDTRGVQGS